MTELLTAEQMRGLEQAAITSGEVLGLDLMELAGQGVVEALDQHAPLQRDAPHRALILCGPGNNGGDGFVIARLLADRGWTVDVYLFGDPEKLPPDAQKNHNRFAKHHAVHPWSAQNCLTGAKPDVIIDAVFGIGLTRPLPAAVARVLTADMPEHWIGAGDVFRLAVDCPSGLNLDTGRFIGPTKTSATDDAALPHRKNASDLTVTFHTPKPGHYLGQGPELCGALHIVDIGLRGAGLECSLIGTLPDIERVRLTEPRYFGASGLSALKGKGWPGRVLPKACGGAHKYDFGHVIVFSGGVGRGGAGRLAARAALRVGAGLVTLVCPKAAVLENAMHLNAVMLRGLDDPERLHDVADDRVSGFCIGPGLGVGARTKALVAAVLKREKSPRRPVVVLDADALTSFAATPDALFAMLHERAILTPHEGEFARLFPDLAAALGDTRSKIDVVRLAAKRAGCVILLKGADTVIATPDGRACVHAAAYDRAVPWLATAGAGDVLAGLIAGLAASRLSGDLIVMAEVAVWLHAECARSFGPGLIAEDLAEELPKVLSSYAI
ncbi:MAG: NAD(P)H-hydrate dehydratase [Paracoccaceae bacterium]|nr:NAD(P)H-hydrate dehydratase [Paracoccaceae bacterium]